MITSVKMICHFCWFVCLLTEQNYFLKRLRISLSLLSYCLVNNLSLFIVKFLNSQSCLELDEKWIRPTFGK